MENRTKSLEKELERTKSRLTLIENLLEELWQLCEDKLNVEKGCDYYGLHSAAERFEDYYYDRPESDVSHLLEEPEK